MKHLFIPAFIFATMSVLSCNNATDNQGKSQDSLMAEQPDLAHNSQNSLDWTGVYQDTIPCADCPGILTTIEIKEDKTFKYQAEYLDRDLTLADSGSFEWTNDDSAIHLKGETVASTYKVGENVLIATDSSGNKLEGPNTHLYNLKKIK